MGIDQITPYLHVSNYFAAVNHRMLEKAGILEGILGILEVLTVGGKQICANKRGKHITYHYHVFEDAPESNILVILDELMDIIQKAINAKRNILVHCMGGISRSVTVCCAWMMKSESWTFVEALSHVRKAHSSSWPNYGFVGQLQIFERLSWRADFETLNASKEYRDWLIMSGNMGKKATREMEKEKKKEVKINKGF